MVWLKHCTVGVKQQSLKLKMTDNYSLNQISDNFLQQIYMIWCYQSFTDFACGYPEESEIAGKFFCSKKIRNKFILNLLVNEKIINQPQVRVRPLNLKGGRVMFFFLKKIFWFPMLLKKIFWFWWRKKKNLIQSFCHIT